MPTDTGPLDAVVREMLRPMLKAWLDEHLPEIVEQLGHPRDRPDNRSRLLDFPAGLQVRFRLG